MKKKIVVICILFVTLIVTFTIFIKVFSKKKYSLNGNLSNNGLVVQDENGNVFYNKYGEGIYNLNNKISDDVNVYSMQIVDDLIYYLVVNNANDIQIKSVEKNGNNCCVVSNINASLTKMIVYNDYIYYVTNQSDGGIEKIDLKGINKSKIISGKIKDFDLDRVNKKIAYIDNGNKIHCTNISGQKDKIIDENAEANEIQIVGNWIYYHDIKENALFRINRNGNFKTLISTLVKNDIYNVYDKYVYYYDQENQAISRMEIGKSNNVFEIKKLDTSKTKINVANDEMYYLDKSQIENKVYQMFKIKLDGQMTESIEY